MDMHHFDIEDLAGQTVRSLILEALGCAKEQEADFPDVDPVVIEKQNESFDIRVNRSLYVARPLPESPDLFTIEQKRIDLPCDERIKRVIESQFRVGYPGITVHRTKSQSVGLGGLASIPLELGERFIVRIESDNDKPPEYDHGKLHFEHATYGAREQMEGSSTVHRARFLSFVTRGTGPAVIALATPRGSCRLRFEISATRA